ncbi:MAG: outer membrane protein assembly factor BamE [Rhodocyclaceae bacterium]|nr:outer membrane protein assembly factor BamE [Rhodocyclaceae bacterium]
MTTTSKHSAPRAARYALLAATLGLGACAVSIKPPITGYTCCNLHPSYDWVSSNNVLSSQFVAAGEPATYDSIKRGYYVYGTIGGQYISLRDDNARSSEDTMRWVRKIIVDKDPLIELATWPARTQAAVRSGKVVPGMTRQQVLMALGHPSPADTPNLASGTWHYWSAIDDTPIDIGFDAAGLLRDIMGSQPSIRMVRYAD